MSETACNPTPQEYFDVQCQDIIRAKQGYVSNYLGIMDSEYAAAREAGTVTDDMKAVVTDRKAEISITTQDSFSQLQSRIGDLYEVFEQEFPGLLTQAASSITDASLFMQYQACVADISSRISEQPFVNTDAYWLIHYTKARAVYKLMDFLSQQTVDEQG